MYTSGTTGSPKGVMVTHRMLRLSAEAVRRVTDLRQGDVFLVWEPFYHIGGAQLIVLPLVCDMTLAMIERFSARRFWNDARESGATHIHYLGGILQILLKQAHSPLDREHKVRIAWGGGCQKEVWTAFEKRFGVRIRECYGMTEASSITTSNRDGKVGSVGFPTDWFEVGVLDPDGVACPIGTPGEIVVRGKEPEALFGGYFRDPEASRRALRNGLLHTGDLGALDADGALYFLGRMTDSVRCKGENVSAWEVEQVAAGHPAVEDSAMVGVAADVGEQDIKLFVKIKEGETLDLSEFSEWLAQRLASYQTPRYLAVVPDFPRTSSHRIRKHLLPRGTNDCWDRDKVPAAT